MGRIVISLDHVRMFGRIGVMEQERVVGNDFTVNVAVELDSAGFSSERLDSSVSYADIFEEVRQVMSREWQLLESVAMEIGARLQARWPQIEYGRVSITKERPPISSFDGSATVSYEF